MQINTLYQAAYQQFNEGEQVANQFLSQKENINAIVQAAQQMAQCLEQGGKIISCGNGGSMCDAMHFAEELSGKYRSQRPALAALAISNPAHISCVANDYSYEQTFARFIEALGNKQDILLALSTSGNSPNILAALAQAKQQKLTSILLSGKTGGKAQAYADYSLLVPHEGYSDRIQEIHIRILHVIIYLIEKQLFV